MNFKTSLILAILCTVVIVRCEVTITRDVLDYRTAISISCWDAHSTSSLTTCTCVNDYNTIMSQDDSKWGCSSPYDLGCKFSLTKSKQTHLVTKRYETLKVYPTAITTSPDVYEVAVWNEVSDSYGKWYDITTEASHLLTFVPSEGKAKSVEYISVKDINLKVLQGHIFKITFGDSKAFYRPCLTFKVKGERKYPFKINDLKTQLIGKITTAKPPIPTHHSVTERTTKRTSREKVETTQYFKPTTISKMTTPAKTTAMEKSITTSKNITTTTTIRTKTTISKVGIVVTNNTTTVTTTTTLTTYFEP